MEINVDSFFDGVWEKITYPGHYVVNQLAIYQSSEKREKRNPLAENPAEYLKILAEIESHCSEKDQSCGPSLNYWEREKIENSVQKVTRWAPANRFAQIIKNFVIKRKTKKPGKLINFNVHFSHIVTFSHSQMEHYFFSYLITCEVYIIKVLEIMAQILQYITFLSLKAIKVSSDFILNYLKKVVGGATAQKYQKQMLKP